MNSLPETEIIKLIPQQKRLANKVILKTSESIYVLNVDDIIRCEADGGYTHFFTNDNKKIIISKTLKQFSAILTEQKSFFRIHNSHLINLNYMERFDKKEGGLVIMKDKTIIPVSNRKKNELLMILNSVTW